MNRAWPLLPRSWQNLKLSLEVFANQDLIKAVKKKKICVVPFGCGLLSETCIFCVSHFFFTSVSWIASIKGLTAEVDGE